MSAAVGPTNSKKKDPKTPTKHSLLRAKELGLGTACDGQGYCKLCKRKCCHFCMDCSDMPDHLRARVKVKRGTIFLSALQDRVEITATPDIWLKLRRIAAKKGYGPDPGDLLPRTRC